MFSSIQDTDLNRDGRNRILSILNCVTGCLSMLGCIWIYCFYFFGTENRPFSLKLVLALSTADFMFSISNIITFFDADNNLLCCIEGIMRNFSVIASLYFAASIAVWANSIFSRGLNHHQQKSFFMKILITGIVVSGVFSLAHSNYFKYWHESFGCFVVSRAKEPTSADKMMILIVFFVLPFIIAFLVAFSSYMKIAKKWKNLSQNLLINNNVIVIYKLFLYPVVLFLSHSPSIIDDILSIYYPLTDASFVFNIIHILLCHSAGFINAFVYGYLRRKCYIVENYDEDRQTESNKKFD